MDPIVKEAVELAKRWQERANELINAREKARHRQLARLMENPHDKVVLTKTIDQSFRSVINRRVADQICSLLTEYGTPGFFSPIEKLLMILFLYVGRRFPDLTVPQIIKKMRADSRHEIIPGESHVLQAYLQKRNRQGARVNINHLGEAVLGEKEALSRLAMYINDLKNPAIEYISVKISTIFSQIQPLAFEDTVGILKDRLSQLYRAAAAQIGFYIARTPVMMEGGIELLQY